MRPHAAGTSGRILFCLWMCVSTAATVAGAGQSAAQTAGAQIERDVLLVLQDERDLRSIEVSVEGGEVTLRGVVPTLWAKSEAIRKTFDVNGVETVASELEIPSVERDEDLIQEVAKAVYEYPYYTVWDYIEGGVNDGVVTLTGSVTADRDKPGAIFERVAKIRGVQDVRSTIETQSASSFDVDLRYALSARIFNDIAFEEFARWPNPPFHLIVDRSVVTLKGAVRSESDKRRLEQLVRHTPGVLRMVSDLQAGQ